MDFNAFKECVIARCKELGITEYELYYTSGESTSVGVFQDSISEFTASVDGGVLNSELEEYTCKVIRDVDALKLVIMQIS